MRQKCFFFCGSFGNFLISVFPWKSTLEGHWKTRESVFSEQAEKVKAVCKCLPWWTLGSNKEAHKKAYKYPAYLPFLGIFPGIRGWKYSQRLDREEYTRAASPAAPLPLHHVQNYPSISTASWRLFPCCDHVAGVRRLQPTLVFIRLLGTTWPPNTKPHLPIILQISPSPSNCYTHLLRPSTTWGWLHITFGDLKNQGISGTTEGRSRPHAGFARKHRRKQDHYILGKCK